MWLHGKARKSPTSNILRPILFLNYYALINTTYYIFTSSLLIIKKNNVKSNILIVYLPKAGKHMRTINK